MKKSTLIFTLVFISALLSGFSLTARASCPEWMNQDFRKLHSGETLNLCALADNKPMLIVNTASHCGFTYQFKALETVHKNYENQGLQVIGFPSNDFRQEAKDEAKTAKICFVNYGVSFTMAAPIHVKGQEAHPLFQALAEKSQVPQWNFGKYLISADGSSVQYFGSRVEPDSKILTQAIETLISN
ncbi:MAG: glutathione peroxidase [Cellvibrionaceae bacterium]|jgi:glutathione peroxidase